MFKLMIADDNPYALGELRDMVDWESLDLALIGAYPNGKELLDAAKAEIPDIVITDISMPVLNGIALTTASFSGVIMISPASCFICCISDNCCFSSGSWSIQSASRSLRCFIKPRTMEKAFSATLRLMIKPLKIKVNNTAATKIIIPNTDMAKPCV